MCVLFYYFVYDVWVEFVFDFIIQEVDDIILKVIVMVICGFDLYLYCGKIFVIKVGDIFGYEFMGVVVEIGFGVKCFKKGDCVVVFFVIVCGQCFFCDQYLYVVCEIINFDCGVIMNGKGICLGVVMFGYSYLYGGMLGGQVEYVWVFKVDVGFICIDLFLVDEQVLFLSDIFLIGYQVVKNVGVCEGFSVVIYGVGLVGQMVVVCVCMFGVEKIFIVDYYDYWLCFVVE